MCVVVGMVNIFRKMEKKISICQRLYFTRNLIKYLNVYMQGKVIP